MAVKTAPVRPAAASSTPGAIDIGLVVSIVDVKTRRRRQFIRPDSDIDLQINFSVVRCILSIVSLLLVLTDIPRTGLSLTLKQFYGSVGAGLVMYWGPFAYPSVHIRATALDGNITKRSESLVYSGQGEEGTVETASLWAYKFDTLSIPPRGIAEYLNVTAYPRCILYKEPCAGSTLSLATTFNMLDQLIEALQRRYWPQSTGATRAVVFVTRSNWIDRLHHALLKPLWRRNEKREHALHHYRVPPLSPHSAIHFCDGNTVDVSSTHHDRSSRASEPLFCHFSLPWMCDDLTLGAAKKIPLRDHINGRLVALQKQYPSLEFDLTLIVTRIRLISQSSWPMRRIYLASDNVEMTTLIRGRTCTQDESPNCETRVIDDYRYERAHSESDEEDWRRITGSLRGLAQGYVWLRIALLWWGCYSARTAEPKFATAGFSERLRATLITFLKIPSYAITYGSWLPICCYSIAHSIDGAMIHLVGEYVWTSINGQFQFDLLQFVRVASIQMRNIWFIALLWRLFVLAYAYGTSARLHPWLPEDGIKAGRGMLIGLTSWLTIFSFMRSLSFRDVDVHEIWELPAGDGATSITRNSRGGDNVAEYGFQLDLKVSFMALVIVTGSLLVLQLLLRATTAAPVSFFTCQSYYVPLSADVVWSRSALSIFWFVSWNHWWDERRRRSVDRLLERLGGPTGSWRRLTRRVLEERGGIRRSPETLARCPVCRPRPWYLQWPATHGCLAHEAIHHTERRSPEIWAIVRLMNIVFMSDPVVLVDLYGRGRTFFLYRHGDLGDGGTRTFLLPRTIDQELTPRRGPAGPHAPLQLVAAIDSRSVPWHAMVDVG